MFKKFFNEIDKALLFLVIAVVAIGILAVASSTATFEEPLRYTLTQVGAFGIGLVFVFLIPSFDYENLAYYWKWIYGLLVVLLLAVLFFGTGEATTGTNRWIRIGGYGFQPAEFVKLLFLVAKAFEQVAKRGEYKACKAN